MKPSITLVIIYTKYERIEHQIIYVYIYIGHDMLNNGFVPLWTYWSTKIPTFGKESHGSNITKMSQIQEECPSPPPNPNPWEDP